MSERTEVTAATRSTGRPRPARSLLGYGVIACPIFLVLGLALRG